MPSGSVDSGPMKSGASGKTIRGSIEHRLTPEGKEDLRALNREIIKRGPPWRIYYSSQMRAAESAHILSENCPSTSFMRPSPEMESWHLGGYEGKKVNDVVEEIKSLVSERPWVVPSGMNAESTKPGESFNAFKSRCLNKVKELMALWEEHPTKRIFCVTHFHNVQLIDAWLAKYQGRPGPEDSQYDSKVYNRDIGGPCEVCWLHKTGGIWKFTRMGDVKKYPIFLPGIYFIRHGSTSAN